MPECNLIQRDAKGPGNLLEGVITRNQKISRVAEAHNLSNGFSPSERILKNIEITKMLMVIN